VQEGGDAMSATDALEPARMPARATCDGEARDKMRSWVEATVWTQRMLAALDEGVKGGKWYSLIDKLYPVAVLEEAFARVRANKGAAGVDHVTIEHYAKDEDANLACLSEELRTGSYRPQAPGL
jgi:RNA-directed DNA polymerase